MADDVYKKAYEREKTARLAAEKLLDEKPGRFNPA